MSIRKASPVGAAYPSCLSSDSDAVTPAIGPLPATYLSASASDEGFTAVWHTVTRLAHLLGSQLSRTPQEKR